MPGIARANDIAVGWHKKGDDWCYNVAILSGSGSVFSDGRGITRLNDSTNGNCGSGITIMGSGKTFANGRPVCRLGDLAICFCDGRTDIIITASGKVFSV